MIWTAEPWISNFGVVPEDPGYIYILEHQNLFKIGRSKNPDKRIRDARTWLPMSKIVGIKPFWQVGEIEKLLQIGLATYWVSGEWIFFGKDNQAEEYIISDFQDFSDTNINKNSVDFIYFYNSSGMSESCIEQNQRKCSIKRFLREETWVDSNEIIRKRD